MYRISVTTIEKFNRYMIGASSYDTEESLIESLKGIFLGNDKTRTGSAYHKVIEREALVVDGGLVADNIFFTSDQARAGIEFKRRHLHMIHEVPVSKIYYTRIGPVMVSGRVDGLEGKEIRDTKCKFRTPGFQEYVNSYQWRYYLSMLLLDIFYYDIFEVKGFTDLRGLQPYHLPGVSFEAHDPLQCVRYRDLEDDCLSMLNRFLDYIELRNFWSLLKTVPTVAA